MKKENKIKFEKMVSEALEKFWKDSHDLRIYEILQKAQKYRENENILNNQGDEQ
jgi:hypothetical protein